MKDIGSRLIGLESGNTHADALRLLLEIAVQAVKAQEGSILLLDENSQELVFLMTGGDLLSEFTLRGQRLKVGEGLTGQAAKTGDIQVGAPTLRTVTQPDHHNFKAPTQIIAAPMFSGSLVVGAITAASYEPDRRFVSDDKVVFKRLAAVAGIIVSDRKHTWQGDDPLLGLSSGPSASQGTVWW